VKLNILNSLPADILSINSTQLHDVIGGPTIVHLNKEANDHLVISCLLHGNETTGFYGIVDFLKSLDLDSLGRGIVIIFGNTLAAKTKVRHLSDQRDYNRIWDGGESDEEVFANDVIDYCKELKLFASIDIHNNTGKNPYYGCVNLRDTNYLNLARAFSKKIVYFTEPKEVCSMAFSKICPAVTIEAGQPDLAEGIDKVKNYLLQIYHINSLEELTPAFPSPIFYTNARIKVHKEARIDFHNELTKDIDISLISTLELLNFDFINEGKCLGWCRRHDLFTVVDNEGFDVTEQYFEFVEDRIITKRMFIPSMFTMNEFVLKEDCLGYIMQVLE
jgi:hypothetical protein